MDCNRGSKKLTSPYRPFLLWGKVALLVIGFLLGGERSQAQFGGAIETMLKQIAALGAYKELCTEGYKIAETGIDAIKTVKGAEFDLHSVYFTSLKHVSPQVASYLSQTGALTAANHLVSDLRRFSTVTESSSVLQPTEKKYMSAMLNSFIDQVHKDEDMIATLLANGETSMSDGERISLLMAVVQVIREQQRSAVNVIDQTSLLMRRRAVEINDNSTILSFY